MDEDDGPTTAGNMDLVIVLPNIGQADFSNQRHQGYVSAVVLADLGNGTEFVELLEQPWILGQHGASGRRVGTDAYFVSDAGHSRTSGVRVLQAELGRCVRPNVHRYRVGNIARLGRLAALKYSTTALWRRVMPPHPRPSGL
ncbi:hypothetical protein [Kitasatospora sp. NPDC051914]|uniref:hypothetical protein n=1 Tax=Kitasatospora sp. NPDC051914 TaxID=3154945 RepID=UPI0034394CDE